jgi:hypothetical protein
MGIEKRLSKSIKIVLLGSIPKGDEERKAFIDWKKEYIKKITKEIPNVKFLYGDLISDKVGPELVVGHDLWLIKHADLVIVNTVPRVGAGTAQEMIVAKIFKKPVISVIPKNTYHRRSNIIFDGTLIKDWIHPFLLVSSDVIVETVNEAIFWIKSYMKDPRKIKIKDFSTYTRCILDFEKKLSSIVKSYKNRGW